MSKEEKYINDVFTKETDHLIRIRKALEKDHKAGVHLSPYEGKILQLLIKLRSSKSILEIGTLYGYSTLWMAYALGEENGGKIVSLEKNELYAKKARQFLDQTKVGHLVEILIGDARELLTSKLLSHFSSPLDFVFIDADKASYEVYLDWTEKCLPKKGLVVADNTFLFGNVFSLIPQGEYGEKETEIMRNFNRRLANTKKYSSILLPTSEGLTVAQKLF